MPRDDYDPTLEDIMSKEVDEEELDKVSGGDDDKFGWCVFNERCFNVFLHPKEKKEYSACFSNYRCWSMVNHIGP